MVGHAKTLAEHPVERLFGEVSTLRYPAGVVPTRGRIENPEFFPGGYGLWRSAAGQPLPRVEPGGVVVLGHNLDSAATFQRNLKSGGVDIEKQPTFRNLKRLLDRAGVEVEQLFLTNFFMGCGTEQIGKFPGRHNRQFVAECARIARLTCEMLAPRLLLILGRETWSYLDQIAAGLGRWSSARSFLDVDRRGDSVLSGLRVAGTPEFAAVSVVHPSFAPSNWRWRRYQGFTGLDAEAAMIRHALQCAGSP